MMLMTVHILMLIPGADKIGKRLLQRPQLLSTGFLVAIWVSLSNSSAAFAGFCKGVIMYSETAYPASPTRVKGCNFRFKNRAFTALFLKIFESWTLPGQRATILCMRMLRPTIVWTLIDIKFFRLRYISASSPPGKRMRTWVQCNLLHRCSEGTWRCCKIPAHFFFFFLRFRKVDILRP